MLCLAGPLAMLLALTPSGEPPVVPASLESAADAQAEPFAFGDFTWMNGNVRQHKSVLDSKYFTGSAVLDINYVFSFNRPIDDTLVGSTVTGRHNEVGVLMLSMGGDLHYENARASLTLQFGQTATLVTRNDPSVNRGQYDLATAFRFIREAYAGYHWDALHGINLDFGIFMSYVGLFSYVNADNWAYQPSYVSDNTPFFFQGARLQIYPTDRVKIEFWLINGWQTYAKFEQFPGLGYQVNWRPAEWISAVFNGYVGTDTQDAPHRVRLHSDNSLVLRYFNDPTAALNRGALSFTVDLGGEQGNGVSLAGQDGTPAQNFVGFMFYNRLWFAYDLGLTLGGGLINNPGRYLVLAVPGATSFTQEPGNPFLAWDLTATFDWAPVDWIMFRVEGNYRHASVDYFAGRGGITSADGFTTTSDIGFNPDLRRDETRVNAAVLFRM